MHADTRLQEIMPRVARWHYLEESHLFPNFPTKMWVQTRPKLNKLKFTNQFLLSLPFDLFFSFFFYSSLIKHFCKEKKKKKKAENCECLQIKIVFFHLVTFNRLK